MSHRQADRLDDFLGFLYCSDGVVEVDLELDLQTCGVNLRRLDIGVTAILDQASQRSRPAWLERAREKRARFETVLKTKSVQWAQRFQDSRSFVDAALAGRLGGGVQSRAQVFFRNKKMDELSPRDMKSFLEDVELLDMLQGPSKPDEGDGA